MCLLEFGRSAVIFPQRVAGMLLVRRESWEPGFIIVFEDSLFLGSL